MSRQCKIINSPFAESFPVAQGLAGHGSLTQLPSNLPTTCHCTWFRGGTVAVSIVGLIDTTVDPSMFPLVRRRNRNHPLCSV
jgi:hypothetical protein